MEYQDCLEKCIEDCAQNKNINKRNKNKIVKFYRGYPIPNDKLWAKCERKAVKRFGDDADFQSRMGQYEYVLQEQGFQTAKELQIAMAINTIRALMAGRNK